MKTIDNKKSAIENNIKDIQKRIQELEQSFDSVNKEMSVEEEAIPERASYNKQMIHEKSFSKYSANNYDNRSKSNLRQNVSRRDRHEEEYNDPNENFETRKMIEGLIRENDILRENEKQADVKIETRANGDGESH